MKKILICITGSIAVFDISHLIQLFQRDEKHQYEINVILTETAEKFVTRLTFESILQHRIYTDDDMWKNQTLHIGVSRNCDCILIAPATANTISKIAHGMCDNLVTNVIAGRQRHVPCLVAPAMNREMWANPANLRNLQTLENDGFIMIPPETGKQICGEVGIGKIAKREDIFKIVKEYLQI